MKLVNTLTTVTSERLKEQALYRRQSSVSRLRIGGEQSTSVSRRTAAEDPPPPGHTPD
jgi:hypothetical protein